MLKTILHLFVHDYVCIPRIDVIWYGDIEGRVTVTECRCRCGKVKAINDFWE